MNALGQRTLVELRRAQEGKQASTLVALTTLLDALAKKGDTATLAELSALVKSDQHLIARALGRANSLGIRPGSLPVTTVSDAFHLLGTDRVRSLSLSSLLAQHANTANQAQREMALFSLSTGLVAQTLAGRAGEDPEQAFLCGSLRCYGHLILSTLQPDAFDLARHEARGSDDECSAFRHVFGVTPYELAHHALEDSQIPRELLHAMIRPSDIGATERRSNPMLNLAIGSVAFSDLLFDPRLGPEDFRERAQALLARHAPDAGFQDDVQLESFLRAQHAHFDEFARCGEFRDMVDRPIVSIGQRINNVALARSPIVPGRVSHHLQTTAPKVVPLAAWEPDTLRPEALGRIALELGASDVLLFGLDRGAFHLTRGTGEWSVSLRGSRLFAAGDKNLFGLCVALRQSLAIHDAADATVHPHTPAWMKVPSAPAAFFVMPLGGATVTQVLLVGWPRARKVVPPAPTAILAFNQALADAAA